MNRMFEFRRHIFLLFLAVWLSGCATVAGPYKAAETAEQKAFALYGTFVVFEERGAEIVNDTRIDVKARKAIQRADAVAKPVADAMLDSALEVNAVRTQLDSDPNKLQVVVDNLESWILRFEPLVQNLVSAIKRAK